MKQLYYAAFGLIAACGFVLSSHASTVFSDTFGTSTLDVAPTAPTSTSTSYENFSQGAGPASTIASGNLHLLPRTTASVFGEINASFTSTPVTLATAGDLIDLQIVFTDTANVLLSGDNASAQVAIGLFNSGGTSLLQGTRLDAGTASTGGAAGYTGYMGRLFLNGNANVVTRPVQVSSAGPPVTGDLSRNQDLLFNNAGSGAYNSPTGSQIGGTTATGFTTGLTAGNQYTLDYSVTLATATSQTITESLYSGNGTGGTLLAQQTVTENSILDNSFDTLGIGLRHTGASLAADMDLNSILVTTNVPEPATLALSTLGGLGLLALRRWKRRE